MPAFGRINSTETTMSLMELTQALNVNSIPYCFSTQSLPDIAELRNMLLTLWFDRLTDWTHTLLIDADMGFPAQLVLDMLAFDQPLVGCLYPKKTNPINFVGRPKPGAPLLSPCRKFMQMEGIGAGVMLIRRDCVETMLEQGAAKSDPRLGTHNAAPLLAQWGVTRIIRAFDEIQTATGKMSEDLSFCRRHIECGGQVWANISHKITHVGPYGFSGRFADTLNTPIPGDA